jgi:hypothetical protein
MTPTTIRTAKQMRDGLMKNEMTDKEAYDIVKIKAEILEAGGAEPEVAAAMLRILELASPNVTVEKTGVAWIDEYRFQNEN